MARRGSGRPAWAAIVAVLAAAGCDPGTIGTGDDAGHDAGHDADVDYCDGVLCQPGMVCRGGGCVPEGDDPCEGVTCLPDERCLGGVCQPLDPCDGVVCPNPGEVCSGGVCVAGEADSDLDGYTASDDCDDLDPSVNPGAAETCDAVDEDCDGAVDEELSNDCSTDCGAGAEVCQAGDWLPCTAPVPSAEVCDARDNDCDGTADDGLSRPCATDCGTGTERCAAGVWGSCDAPVPRAETCGDCGDENCDGTAQTCDGDTIAVADLGGRDYEVTVCADEGYVCIELQCRSGGARIGGGLDEITGSYCWHMVVGLDPGVWDCTFTRQRDSEGVACEPGDEETQACVRIDAG